MKKQLIYILIGFILLALGAGFWVWKKQVNLMVLQDQIKKEEVVKTDADVADTSDWKTYRSDKAGFEIKYPNDWRALENAGDNSDRSIISLISPGTQKLIQDRKSYSSCDFSIYYYPSVRDEPENKMNGFKATTIEEMINKNSMITQAGQATLGGEQATDVVWGGAGANYTILSGHANHLYIISSCNKERRDALTPTEITILENFKFFDK
jgi:hypothetical protein